MTAPNSILKFINDSLKEKSFSAPRFTGSEFYGLATQVTRDNDGTPNSVDFVMACFDNKGEVIKDNLMFEKNGAPLQIYHRLWGSSFQPDPKESWGNEEGNKRLLQYSMLVFFRRDKIQLSAEDVELLISMGLPSSLPRTEMPAGMDSCSITPAGSDFNQSNLLNREFKLQNYTLEPEAVLFEFKYTLECKYSKNCINVLCCP